MKEIIREIPWILIMVICAFAAIGILLSQIGEEDYPPEYKASDFTLNQSYLDELDRNRSIWIADDFGADNLSIRLPEHPKGNITVYQGDRIVFFFCAS